MTHRHAGPAALPRRRSPIGSSAVVILPVVLVACLPEAVGSGHTASEASTDWSWAACRKESRDALPARSRSFVDRDGKCELCFGPHCIARLATLRLLRETFHADVRSMPHASIIQP